MNSAMLKILACLFMLIDHMGYILFPKLIVFRIIGRLAFPIFAYLIAEGYRKTKDVTNYLGRLFMFALVSQLPFIYAFNIDMSKGMYLNVFFTLAMGLFAIYTYDKNKSMLQVFAIALICFAVNTDYGAFGVLLIFFFNKYYEDFSKMALSAVVLTVIFQGFQGIRIFSAASVFTSATYYRLMFALMIQPLSLFALILIKFYNKKKGWNIKYLFYVFYPLHLIILRLLQDSR